MADERGSRTFSDAPASLLLVDTRASQSLEPIRLPAKLRDRIERAQRRANAAKDGVSIFTTEATASGPAARRSTTAPAAETSTPATLGDTGELRRASTANGTLASGSAGEKMHLPDVVLSHKMRDFEARANTGGGVALFSSEPADRSLQRLSLEDRERVMLAMQSKIRQITSDVDANFARITKALDANGIFDSTANIQRAQALCLVDLQRRCKLDRLRDEAMREVLHLPISSATKTRALPGQAIAAKPSHKLSQLLRPLSRQTPEESRAAVAAVANRKKRASVRTPTLPALRPGSSTRAGKGNQAPPTSSPSPSRLKDKPISSDNNMPGAVRMLSRRGGLAPPSTTSQLVAREDVGFVASSNANASDGDLHVRHPHVAQVLQLLAAGEVAKTSIHVNVNSAEADMEHVRLLGPADEWAQRSASYQAVGARAAEAVRRSGERQRWDTLGHFGSKCACTGAACLPPALRLRLDAQHSSWVSGGSTARSGSDEGVDGAVDAEKSPSSKQQRDKEIYAELQTRIRERLRANERRTRTAAAAVRSVGASSRTRQPQTAPGKLMAASSSTASLAASGVSPSRGNQQLSLHAEPQLGASASAPVLSVAVPTGDTKPSSPQRHSRLGSRARVSVLEQKLMNDPGQSISRRGRRKDSLIGAPPADLDSHAIGRHSEARIAYRRFSAQTWAWNLPPGSCSANAVDTIEEEDEATDRFEEDQGSGEDGSEEEDAAEDGTDYADSDLESVDSSRASFSARSSASMASVKRRVSSGNRVHGKGKKPTAVQRRSSRGAGRSAGNALSSHALSLHARLEVIWRVLQFPFSNNLTMLERLSTLQDADAFLSALDHWERVTPLVAIRQRMKLALSGFAERGELRPNEWLTPSEFALVAALPQPPSTSVAESTPAAMPPLQTPVRGLEAMSPPAFIRWVRDHMDAVTLQTHKLANELKAQTGEDLQFQGHPYPRRG
jgi:hypothetical protein